MNLVRKRTSPMIGVQKERFLASTVEAFLEADHKRFQGDDLLRCIARFVVQKTA